MARFRYTAKSMSGKTKRGTVEALTAKGYQKLKAKQLASFCKELSTLLASGVSLVRALDIISEQEGINSKEREVYQAVLLDLRKGIGLADAMESKKCFPDLMIGMLRAGEGSGNLDQVTERLALQYEKDYKLTQQVRSAMTYPAILLVMCVTIVILIVTFILPQFQSLFDQMESLPAVTNILIAISHFLVEKWYAALLIVFVAVMTVRIIMAIPAVRRQNDYRKVHMPVFGKLFKTIYTARFARTLSSLYSSGMPIATALVIAGKTIGNSYVEKQFEQAVTLVRSGIPMSQALRGVDGLQKKLASTVLVGEESGRLDVMLDSIALSMEADAEEATKRMVTLMEPLLIVFMALIVGFIMIAVMLPIYQSYSAIENS